MFTYTYVNTHTHIHTHVAVFSRNVHDASLPLTVQTTSIRLLMNLVEGIYHKHNSDQEKLNASQVNAFIGVLNT